MVGARSTGLALEGDFWESGFQVYVGPRIQPEEEEAMENGELSPLLDPGFLFRWRMTDLHEESKLLYESKHGGKASFKALEW